MIARYALLLPFLIALPAHAGNHESVAVQYTDLNLAAAQGQATLERRIATAARRVCDAEGNRELAMRAASRKCQIAALDAARPKIQVAIQRAASANDVAGAMAPPGL